MNDYKKAPTIWVAPFDGNAVLGAYRYPDSSEIRLKYFPAEAVREAMYDTLKNHSPECFADYFLDYLRNELWMVPKEPKGLMARPGDRIRCIRTNRMERSL